jgi:hypothetical protein
MLRLQLTPYSRFHTATGKNAERITRIAPFPFEYGKNPFIGLFAIVSHAGKRYQGSEAKESRLAHNRRIDADCNRPHFRSRSRRISI